MLLLVALIIAIPVLLQYFKWFFGDAAGLRQDVEDAAVPDWFAFLRGRYWEG